MNSYGWFVVRLSKFYDNAHLSQADIVRSVGIKQQVLARFEKGERKPTVGFLVALAETYNLSLDYLFGFSDEMYFENFIKRNSKEVGKYIADKRKSLGIPQYAFAKTIGIARRTLAFIEKGQSKIKATTAIALCTTYGVSLNELLFKATA